MAISDGASEEDKSQILIEAFEDLKKKKGRKRVVTLDRLFL